MKKYLVYKVTCKFDGKIYIGCHSTLNKNDRYLGSGVEIKEALKKYGRKAFVKEILFEFDTKEEMLAKEKELVTKEFCMRPDTMNRIEGGGVYVTDGMITVKNPEGGYMIVYNDDPRWLSGELQGVTKGKILVRDKNNNYFQIDKNDPLYISSELIPISKGKVPVVDKQGNNFQVDKNDSRYLSGEFVHNMIITKLPNNFTALGLKHSDDTKKIMSEKASQRIGDKNSSFGTCWITNGTENKKVKEEDVEKYPEFHKGRKAK